MGRYRRVWVVYRKELIETLRDRRTLLAMVVVPIVLYPLLMVVLLEALKTETGRREAERYRVCVPDEAHRDWLRGVLDREDADRKAREETRQRAAGSTEGSGENVSAGFIAHIRSEQVDIDVVAPGQMWDEVSSLRRHAAVLVSPRPDGGVRDENRTVQIVYRDIDPNSEFVHRQLEEIVNDESDRIVQGRMDRVAGGPALLTPLRLAAVSTASPEKQFAKVLASIVPFLLVVMTVTGAMYPAIDLTAGERERGTLETLAVAPVPVGHVVAGKFGVIVTIAMISTTLNLGSMTAMIHFSKLDRLVAEAQPGARSAGMGLFEQGGGGSVGLADAARDSIGELQRGLAARRAALESEAREKAAFLKTAAPIVLLAMAPFAVLFGAVMLATCSFARTFKEAQNYMMPVMMAAVVPAMVVSYMPTVKLEGLMLVMPVANVVVMLRELFLGNYDVGAMALCLLATCFYASVAVVVAGRIYGNEAVLFSDVGSYKTLIRRRFFKSRARPSAATAMLAIALIFPAYFYYQSYLGDADPTGPRFKMVVASSQLLILAMPALLLAWYLKVDVRETFSLRVPKARPFVGAILIAASIVPVANLLQQAQFTYLPGAQEALETSQRETALLTSGAAWVLVLVFAVAPGICEELLFRGFLLAGLRGAMRGGKAIVVVGVLFGLFHMSLYKIPIVSLLGMLLTLICVRTGSIWPAMMVHVAHNGLGLSASLEQNAWLRTFFGAVDLEEVGGGVHFSGRTAIFLAVFLVGFSLLLIDRSRRAEASQAPSRRA